MIEVENGSEKRSSWQESVSKLTRSLQMLKNLFPAEQHKIGWRMQRLSMCEQNVDYHNVYHIKSLSLSHTPTCLLTRSKFLLETRFRNSKRSSEKNPIANTVRSVHVEILTKTCQNIENLYLSRKQYGIPFIFFFSTRLYHQLLRMCVIYIFIIEM